MAGQRILLVEGTDDRYVLERICQSRGIANIDDVIPHGGVQQLLESIPVRLKANDDRDNVYGVVMDADAGVAARWQSIRHRLTQAGYTDVPAQPDAGGTILDPPAETLLPRVGIWIMPDNRTSGILEDFLAFLVPRPNDLLEHAANSVDAIPNPLFGGAARPKALIHTWLAWQSEPGLPYGTAITARFLDPDLPQADVLTSWLDRLFRQDGRSSLTTCRV